MQIKWTLNDMQQSNPAYLFAADMGPKKVKAQGKTDDIDTTMDADTGTSSQPTASSSNTAMNPADILDLFCTPEGSRRLNTALGISAGLAEVKQKIEC